MWKIIRARRSRLTVVDGLFRFHFMMPRGSTGGDLDLITLAEQSGEQLELHDADTGARLGRVTVFERVVRPLGDATGQEEWVVRLQAEDDDAQAALATFPPCPPDPY
jgi:hypothetical protein